MEGIYNYQSKELNVSLAFFEDKFKLSYSKQYDVEGFKDVVSFVGSYSVIDNKIKLVASEKTTQKIAKDSPIDYAPDKNSSSEVFKCLKEGEVITITLLGKKVQLSKVK